MDLPYVETHLSPDVKILKYMFPLSNRDFETLIMLQFNCSRSFAKRLYHICISEYNIREREE